MNIILQKIISNSGYCSRRQAEKLIREGKVKVNNEIAKLGTKIDPSSNIIKINNKILSLINPKIYLKLNKPRNYTCTNRKFKNEKNIFDLVKLKTKLFAIGRLDKDSQGLVLLSNDGNLAQHLSHPKFHHYKVYEVKIKGKIENIKKLNNSFLQGIKLEGEKRLVRAEKIKYLQNNTFIITLSEGKNRQIRRMFEAQNLKIKGLKRLSIASLRLGDLPEGSWKYLSKEEIKELKNNLER